MKKISIISILSIISVIISLLLTGCTPMTEEEKAAYIESRTNRYEVVSVTHYMKPVTNNRGGIINYESAYSFTYIDNNGQLKHYNDFVHYDYGLHKVCIGNENKYVTYHDFDTYHYLYLTEETLKSIS